LLERLEIKNFAIIKELAIDFKNGFTVISGETGAGKSIIVEALSILLGKKAKNSFVRAGEKEASVQALCRIEPKKDFIDEEYGLTKDDSEIILSKNFSASGKTRGYLNGRLVPSKIVSELSQAVFSIHSQHENQLLLDPKNHMIFFDSFAGEKVAKLKSEFLTIYTKLNHSRKQLRDTREKMAEIQSQRDFLKFQIDEITESDIKPGEYEELKLKSKKIANSGRIVENLSSAYFFIKDSDNSAVYNLAMAEKALNNIISDDKSVEKFMEIIKNALFQLEDASRDISDYLQTFNFSGQDQENTESRLNRIDKLIKKYGGSERSVLNYVNEITNNLDEFFTSEGRLEALNSEIEDLQKKLMRVGNDLTNQRLSAAETFKKLVMSELAELDLKKAVFDVRFTTLDEPNENGYDIIEFMIAPNIGEGLHPLRLIASGGELSRAMLAIKGVLKRVLSSDTSIFDEIDSGIGGKTALSVGKKLAKLAEEGQVIAITHLPQIGAFADNNLKVEKIETGGRTEILVKDIGSLEKIKELTRMMGAEETEASQAHAKELFEYAVKEKRVGR
jgi:DNA repair protein RecN (Recombination protein N)